MSKMDRFAGTNERYVRLCRRFGIILHIEAEGEPLPAPKCEHYTLRLKMELIPEGQYERYLSYNIRKLLLPMLRIETERLLLRRVEIGDAEPLFESFADAESSRLDTGSEPFETMEGEYMDGFAAMVEDENRYEEYELTYLSGHNDRTRYYAQKANNNYYKFLFMMGYTLTKSKILEWYLAGSSNTTADMDLIQRFRTAMIIPTSNNNGSGGSSGGSSGQDSNNSANNASPLALNQSLSNSSDSTNSSSDTFTDGYTSYADPLGASQTTASAMTVSNEVAAGLAVATTAIGITCGAIAYTLGKQEVDASE
jgi:hypothetical protein